MQSNEKELAKTMPNAPYTVEQLKWFNNFAAKQQAYSIYAYDLRAFSNFISMNGDRNKVSVRIIKVLRTALESENLAFLEEDERVFLQSLCNLAIELDESSQEMIDNHSPEL